MCQEEEILNNIRVLYQEAQQRRTHLSGIIVNLIGFTITANTLIWSILGKAYIDSQEKNAYWYLFIAALLSSLVVLLWRLYTHSLDNTIVDDVYPKIVFCETKLHIPSKLTQWESFLSRCTKKDHNKNLCEQLEKLKCPEQRHAFISELSRRKKYGCRGHNKINLITLIFIIVMWLISMYVCRSSPLIHWSMIGLIVSASFFCISFLLFYQKNPSHEDIESAISEAKKEMKDSA